MPYPIIIGIGFVLIYLTIQAVKSGRKTPTPTTTPTTKTKLKINWSLMGKVISKIIFAVFIACGLYLWYKHIEVKERLVVEIKTTRVIAPQEEWFFSWRLLPGQYSGGRNSHTLSLEITRDDANSFHAIMHDNGGSRVGGLRLDKKGSDLIGSWSNYLQEDGGDCYLYYKGNNVWAGHHKMRDGSRIDCDLVRRR